MKLIVGLGNPGNRYAHNRHNFGFVVIDALVGFLKAKGPASKHEAEVFEFGSGPDRVLLAKPQTFMNNSGLSVGELSRFFKIATEDVLVLHDELDLELGTLRLKQGGGTAGHNGLNSIAAHLGSEDFWRARLGIGKAKPVERYVLQDFSKSEVPLVEDTVVRAMDVAQLWLEGKTAEAMNKHHTVSKREPHEV